jgi:hypothetical protein
MSVSWALTVLSGALVLSSPALPQEAPPQPSQQAAPAQQTQPEQPAPDATAPRGTVIFSRHQDEDADQDASTPQPKKETPPAAQPTVPITDKERSSLTFTAYDLDVHLSPTESRLAVHARFTVRNTGTEPLPRLALQLSSTLQWENFVVQSAGKLAPIPFVQHTIDTDADHTGKATEAVLTLAEPLASGATIDLTAFYSGEIKQSAERLERIGAPADPAAHADWDNISPETTALRGFGNVLWYPTAAAPVFLGDGARLFQAVGVAKRQQAAAAVHLRLTVEYIGDKPDAAYFCGRREPLAPVSENVDLPVAESPGVATADFPTRPLGFRTLSLFVTDRAATTTDGHLIAAVTDHYDTLPNYAAAASHIQPLLADWLGTNPLTTLNILDQDGQPFEDDTLLVTHLRASNPSTLAPSLVHSLTHAWFSSPQVWLDEGVPQFMSLLWIERTEGREAALNELQKQANTLALAEPALKPDEPATPGQSLILATDEVYYRTKSAAVLWMLRDLAGDDALKHALQLYRRSRTAADDPKEFQHLLEQSANKDLGWFFDDWVYRDRGLPDLAIASVNPRELPVRQGKESGWLIAVEVRNDGDAAVEVPVTVRSGALTATERLRVSGRSSASTRIVFEGTPEEIQLNDGTIPEMGTIGHTKQIVVH